MVQNGSSWVFFFKHMRMAKLVQNNLGENILIKEGGRRQEAGGRRQDAGGRRQEADLGVSSVEVSSPLTPCAQGAIAHHVPPLLMQEPGSIWSGVSLRTVLKTAMISHILGGVTHGPHILFFPSYLLSPSSSPTSLPSYLFTLTSSSPAT